MELKERFIVDRAKALATVLLTRREDLVVKERKEDDGLDYIVQICKEGKVGERLFGVLLKATMIPVTIAGANRYLTPSLVSAKSIGPFLYPVCVFYFTMKDDKGYYTWAYEPLVDDDGGPNLRYHSEASCQALNNESLEEIVAKVNRWYDSYYVKMVS